jgi:hypothetical protein
LDQGVIQHLASDSRERRLTEKLIGLSPEDQSPYDNDSQKPEGLLLRSNGMKLDTIPPIRMGLLLRRLSGALRRLVKQNKDNAPYSLLIHANPFLWLGERVIWFFEKTLLTQPKSNLGGYIRALIIGLILGFIIALLIL